MKITLDAAVIAPEIVQSASSGELRYMLEAIRTELDKRDVQNSVPEMTDDEFALTTYKGGWRNRIESVKAYKERTGLSLVECVRAYDKKYREINQ